MHDSMYCNRLAAEDVERKVGFNNQDPVTILSQFRMARNTA
jgi:hypothetical protein